MSNKNKGLILVLFTAIISGFSVFVNKFAVAVNNPNIFAFAKNTIVVIFLSGLLLAFNKHKILFSLDKKQWGQLILLGLLGGSVPFLLFFKGLSLTSAAQGAFIHKTMFVFVAILAAWFLRERINKNFILGGLFLLAANLMVLKSLNFHFGMGDLLVLLATLLWSAEVIFAKYILRDLSGNLVAWGRMFFGAIFIFIYLGITGQATQALAINQSQFGWILITAVLLFGYTATWYNGLKHIPASLASTILLLGMPITTLLAASYSGKLVSKDIYSGILIVGGLIIIIGFDRFWKQIKNYVRT
jgi:drug/metabolite transporter (DMT)-like permease